MGLCDWPAVGLAELRIKAEVISAQLRAGIDPLAEKQAAVAAQAASISFAKVAEQSITTHVLGWRNAKHRQQWRSSLATFAAPIASMPVGAIDAPVVLRVLTPIWTKLPETASRCAAGSRRCWTSPVCRAGARMTAESIQRPGRATWP